MRVLRKSLSAALLASVALLAVALPATASTAASAACYPPSASCPTEPAIIVNPSSVPTSGTFTVTVIDGSFQPNAPYTITLTDPSGTVVATYTGTTTAAGGIQATLTLPGSVGAGTYVVSAIAASPDVSAEMRTLTGDLTVVTAGPPPTTARPGGTTPLPLTGASTTPKVWLGGGLLVAGLVAVVLTTWRRRETVEA